MSQQISNGVNRGFAIILATLLVLSAGLAIILGVSYISLNNIKAVRNNLYSVQAYYAAESGIEDSLLRLLDPDMKDPDTASYSLTMDGAEATLEISKDPISGSYTIISQGDKSNRIRKAKIELAITVADVSFHYGVQVGEEGLTMDSNSEVYGNVYSNGQIIGSSNTKIYGDVYSASSSGKIDKLNVLKSSPEAEDGNAHANTISNSNIANGAYYQTIIDTTAGSYHQGSPDPPTEQMPISEQEISNWTKSAASGGEIDSYLLGGNDEDSLGPVKINGSLTVASNAILTITGTIWVTGNVILESNAVLQLDSTYGTLSDVMVAGGRISLDSNVVICGSEGYKGQRKCNPSVGSYLMLLSTDNSLDPNNPAILSKSNTATAILYTNQGITVLDSNSKLKEATAYALHLNSHAEVTYETGLANAQFTSGPGASYEVVEWKEIE